MHEFVKSKNCQIVNEVISERNIRWLGLKKKTHTGMRKRYIDSVVCCITDKNIIAAYHLTRNMKCRKTLDASEN